MKNSKSYSELFNEVNALTENGHDILEVNMDGNINFFLVSSFEPPVGGTVHTAPYLQFEGVLINEFLCNSIFNQGDVAGFNSVFDQKYAIKSKLKFKLSENHQWRFYTN
jgi:hypothetical protein